MTTKAVLKIGGEVIARPEDLLPTLRDVARLAHGGVRVAMVHGAGPQAGALQEALGLRPRKIAGQRVTDAATLRAVKCALAGEASVDLVAAAVGVGLRAVGIAGVSDRVVGATRRPPTAMKEASAGSGEPDLVDLGLVGLVARIRTELIEHLWSGGFVPVICPLGLELADVRAEAEARAETRVPQVFNINADTVAAALAGALAADHLLLVTAVGGVRRDKSDPTTRIPALRASEARAAIEDGTIEGGMIPKVEEALEHLALGVGAVHILPPGAGIVHDAVEAPGRHGTVLLAD